MKQSSSKVFVNEVRSFLSGVAPLWSPVAWLNPVPAWRWRYTTAAQIAQLPLVKMIELTEDGFINAVDVLRGK